MKATRDQEQDENDSARIVRLRLTLNFLLCDFYDTLTSEGKASFCTPGEIQIGVCPAVDRLIFLQLVQHYILLCLFFFLVKLYPLVWTKYLFLISFPLDLINGLISQPARGTSQSSTVLQISSPTQTSGLSCREQRGREAH